MCRVYLMKDVLPDPPISTNFPKLNLGRFMSGRNDVDHNLKSQHENLNFPFLSFELQITQIV